MKSTIGIPNPCSEDWNKMKPTDRGAYCSKCQFDVIDFTNKSPEEIKMVLKQNTGKKTCGHISQTQLEMVNTNYHIWQNQPVSIFRSKFLYACVMVFGMALFTSCESVPKDGEVVGDVEQIDVGMIEEDTLEHDVLIDGLMEEMIPLEP